MAIEQDMRPRVVRCAVVLRPHDRGTRLVFRPRLAHLAGVVNPILPLAAMRHNLLCRVKSYTNSNASNTKYGSYEAR